MTATIQAQFSMEIRQELSLEAQRILRRLAESGAVLAFAQDMEKAVVVRDLPGGETARTAVVDREVAEVMALNEWIQISGKGRVSRYTITGIGRAALKRMLAEQGEQPGMEEVAQPFAAQHRDMDTCGDQSGRRRKQSYNLAESPLTTLARRKDKNGQPFLGDDLVAGAVLLHQAEEAVAARLVGLGDLTAYPYGRRQVEGQHPADVLVELEEGVFFQSLMFVAKVSGRREEGKKSAGF